MLSATGIHKGFDGLGVLRGIDLNVEIKPSAATPAL